MAPAASTVNVPVPRLEVPSIKAFVSVIATSNAPVLFRETALPKLLAASVSVITAAPVVKLAVPIATELLMPPAPCVIAPPAVIAILRSDAIVRVGTT